MNEDQKRIADLEREIMSRDLRAKFDGAGIKDDTRARLALQSILSGKRALLINGETQFVDKDGAAVELAKGLADWLKEDGCDAFVTPTVPSTDPSDVMVAFFSGGEPRGVVPGSEILDSHRASTEASFNGGLARVDLKKPPREVRQAERESERAAKEQFGSLLEQFLKGG